MDGAEVGRAAAQIGWVLAAFGLGGARAQYPAGWVADKCGRRWVLIGLSAAATARCAITVGVSGTGLTAIMVTAGLFGLTSFPIYSVAAAHAHDFADPSERVELSAALMFFFALGAIAAPLMASALIDAFGPSALFAMIALGHVGLILFGLARMLARPAASVRTRYIWAPRTSFIIGWMTGRDRDGHAPRR